MMDIASYAAAWEAKKGWYLCNGVLPLDEGGGTNGALIWTDDTRGVDVPAWKLQAERAIGPAGQGRPAFSWFHAWFQT